MSPSFRSCVKSGTLAAVPQARLFPELEPRSDTLSLAKIVGGKRLAEFCSKVENSFRLTRLVSLDKLRSHNSRGII